MIWLRLFLLLCLTGYNTSTLQNTGHSAPKHKRQSGISFGSLGNSCSPPNTCVNLNNCKPFEIRARDRSPENIQFLKSAICGFAGSTPMVCCPPLTEPRPPQTDRPRPPPRRTDPPPPPVTNPPPPPVTNPPPRPITNAPPPTDTESDAAVCGKGSFETRVVGGAPADLGDWPWTAAIFVDREFSCGGTLISRNFILTAAHCIKPVALQGRQLPASAFAVRLGDLDLSRRDEGGTPITVRVKSAIPHPNFRLTDFHNDIGVLQLSTPVQYNDFIKPACLPSKIDEGKTYEDIGAVLTGWGTIGFEKEASPRLQFAILKIFPLDTCVTAYDRFKATNPIVQTQLCAGDLNGRVDACQGDSGGPLVAMDPPGTPYTLVGVVSFGFRCAERGFPGIYTRVTSYLDWIEENTKLL